MASSSKPQRLYDVFLSFRGTDVRNNFLGHLYKALKQNGIYTFIDSEELRKGDRISPELMKAIEESCITIIVFSEDYASSRWCLEELVKIMECKEHKNLTVLPVFYRVEPKEVRGGRECYGRAMATHESKLGKNSEEVRRWKKALFDAGSLSGWHLNHEDESELIQSIVNEISNRLARTPLIVAKHPVGIDSQVAKLKSMVDLESNNDVVRVGIWGQGGIGKTTLAKALYNSMHRQFEGSCFLENVRENSKCCRGLVNLQETLLKDILLLKQKLEVSSVDKGINLIEKRLSCKKVLLILDNVDDLQHFDALAGQGNFGDGSMIIVTTRYKQLLTCCNIDQEHVYEVRLLQDSEALELLRRHAFPTDPESEIWEGLVDGVVNYANGLPLALEVLGSLLRGKGEDVWKSTLEQLSRFPDKKINNVLKISYDDLGEHEQKIFLHIVCFFNGKQSGYVKKILDNCDLAATAGLEVLIDRSLISTTGYGSINVHDLIRAMGRGIVNQECQDDLRKRNRLWTYNDVKDVMQYDKGDCAVEAIVLELPEPREMYFNHDAFQKMRRLKLLILRNVHNSFHDPIYLPNDLRWIELTECNWRPEFSSSQKKQVGFVKGFLMGLVMGNRTITGAVKQFEGFAKLKHITLDRCNSLVSTPDVSCAPNLEELRLWGCGRLVQAHRSIAYHDKLQVLEFFWCRKFRDFPKVLESKNLRTFEVVHCPKFERFPAIPYKLEGLKKLRLFDTSTKEIPASIENLVSLEEMEFEHRSRTLSIPSTIYKLQELRKLTICDATMRWFPKQLISADSCMDIGLPKLTYLNLGRSKLSEVEFLESLSCCPLLRDLNLNETNITSLPASISKRDNLSELLLGGCHQLQEIPELPPFLDFLYMGSCESLPTDGHLAIIDSWVRQASLAQDSSRFCRLPGEKMPEWFQHMENGSLSFGASKELYDKFLGLIFCVVGEGKFISELPFEAQFEGKQWRDTINFKIYGHKGSLLLAYVPPSYLWKEVDFGQINGRYAQFSLKLQKSFGLRIICKQLEDHLKTEIRDNQLIDLSLLHEIGNNSTNPKAESSHKRGNDLIQTDRPRKLARLSSEYLGTK